MSRTWTNWVGNQSCTPAEIVSPDSEAGVQSAVRAAATAGRHMRAVATGHSFSPVCATDGTLLAMADLSGITRIDEDAQTVTVRPGTTIAELGDPLWAHGLALRNQGDIDSQQIAGAVSTATHGSGIRLQNMSASVRAARLVTADGSVVLIDENTPDLLFAAQVSVGMLGVFTELTLALRPAYQLREHLQYWNLDELARGWADGFERSHHFTFHYFPTAGANDLFDFEAPDGLDLARMSRVTTCDVISLDEPEQLHSDPRVGRPYRVYPQYCAPNFHELEYMVDFAAGQDAFGEVLEVFDRYPEFATYPIEVRSTAADSAFLSPNHERRSLVISVSGEPGTAYQPFLQAVHDVLLGYQARPHWGKLHLFDRAQLEHVLPRHGDFVALRRQLDPNGMFLNDPLRPLFS
ncbi:D-arabinono-1,4-lactone oxidase [Microbacterium saperdae]